MGWLKMLGEGAVPKEDCPKLLVVAAGVAGADGPLVAFPNSPVDGRGCWPEPWVPEDPRLNRFPLKPPKLLPLGG